MAQLSHPSSALPLIVIRENVRGQLTASRRIFVLVQKIADVARRTDDEEIRHSLEEIMRELLETGKNLSDEATETGNRIVSLMKAQDHQLERSEPA